MKTLWLTTLCLLTASVFSQPAYAQDQEIFGVVYQDVNGNKKLDEGDKRLSGVEVSNLSNIYKTNEEGEFTFPVDNPDIVFVIKPTGYQFPLRDNDQPDFYYLYYPDGTPSSLKYDGVAPTGPLPDTLFFPMHAADTGDAIEANLVGDPQIPRQKENLAFRSEVVSEMLDTDADFSVFLGDIADHDLGIFPGFEKSVNVLDMPLYMVYGNHDINRRAPGNSLKAESYRAFFGPDYYSFNYGKSHFVVLNDVNYFGWNEEKNKEGSYYGGLDKRQMEWLRQDLDEVPRGHHIYLMTHIPIHDRFYNKKNLSKLLDLVEERNRITSLSGHLHGFMAWKYGRDMHWQGDANFRGYSLGAAAGAWWTGPFGQDSLPEATMTDGMPNGFFRFTFDNASYQFDYVPVGKPHDFQLRISTPHNYVSLDSLEQSDLVVNVFTGDERSVVTAQFDEGGRVDTLTQFTGYDPFVLRTQERRVNRDDWRPGPAKTHHLWKTDLPADLAPGTHEVMVKVDFPHRKSYTAHQVFEVRERKPTP